MNVASVAGRPKSWASVDPLTVELPRLPTTWAWMMRGDTPRLVTLMPSSAPLTSPCSLPAAAAIVSARFQLCNGSPAAPS